MTESRSTRRAKDWIRKFSIRGSHPVEHLEETLEEEFKAHLLDTPTRTWPCGHSIRGPKLEEFDKGGHAEVGCPVCRALGPHA